jgi:hypothetical protein
MKKLRMIVTSVVVLAIVGSALAFKVRQATYCISNNGDNTCDTYVDDKKTTSDTEVSSVKYFSGWDGNTTQCVSTSNCSTTIRLVTN